MFARRLVPAAVAGIVAGLAMLSAPAFAAPVAPSVTFTKLTLLNGWYGYSGSAAPAVTNIAGIITFKGAIATSDTSTNNVAFILPPALRPAKQVYIPVDMCNATTGELNVAPTGVTEVISSGANTNATCFTSLDGASFALSTAGFTKLHVRPGWKNGTNGGRTAGARVTGGFVQLVGQIMATGKNPVAFTLPARFRPARPVYVAITLCTGSIGWLYIKPSGVVTVQGAGGAVNWWAVKCGTSLDGASYALSAKSFTPLALENGWTNGPLGTAKAGARVIAGIVHLRGAVGTGSNAVPFTLPTALWPAHEVYISVAMCDGNYGRLDISPTGEVWVQAEYDDFANAQCLTSLDGAWYAR